jgi:hypothetical protein
MHIFLYSLGRCANLAGNFAIEWVQLKENLGVRDDTERSLNVLSSKNWALSVWAWSRAPIPLAGSSIKLMPALSSVCWSFMIVEKFPEPRPCLAQYAQPLPSQLRRLWPGPLFPGQIDQSILTIAEPKRDKAHLRFVASRPSLIGILAV